MENFPYYPLDNRLFSILLIRVSYILAKENAGSKIRRERKSNQKHKILHYCLLNIAQVSGKIEEIDISL